MKDLSKAKKVIIEVGGGLRQGFQPGSCIINTCNVTTNTIKVAVGHRNPITKLIEKATGWQHASYKDVKK